MWLVRESFDYAIGWETSCSLSRSIEIRALKYSHACVRSSLKLRVFQGWRNASQLVSSRERTCHWSAARARTVDPSFVWRHRRDILLLGNVRRCLSGSTRDFSMTVRRVFTCFLNIFRFPRIIGFQRQLNNC